MRDNTIDVFFALLRAGLWEKDVHLLPLGSINFKTIYRLSEEQSVTGIITAGMNNVSDTKIPKQELLQFIGATMQMEEQNKAMNSFISVLVDKMREAGIFTLLVKGQGVAQCYDKPLWRSCGDVDLFLDEKNYQAAVEFLTPLASSVEKEGTYSKHAGMTFGHWVVELHGTLRCGLSTRMDKGIDALQKDTFTNKKVRSWQNVDTEVFLPDVDNDIVFLYTHFLKHFYKGGLGVRQICDWCRLLWTYREEIDVNLLETRLKAMGLETSWHAFAAYAVDYLGMPSEVFPLYIDSQIWHRKARRIQEFVLKSGNFGHNRDFSYYSKYPYLIRKVCSMGVRISDLVHHMRIFPWDSLRFFPRILINGLRSAANGE